MSNPTANTQQQKIGGLHPLSIGTARRLFYWITLLVIGSIAAQLVMDALDVHPFPRRSWSEGISPKIIQSSSSTLFYEYVAVKASDIQTQLPPGVQPGFLGVAAVVQPAGKAAKVLLRLMTIPEDLFLLAVVWILRSMVLSTWNSGRGAVTPFIRANVWRLRCIAIVMAALWGYHLLLPQLTEELSSFSALHDFGPIVAEAPPWYLTNGSLGVALLLLILAEVFSHGVRLQDDVEGLV